VSAIAWCQLAGTQTTPEKSSQTYPIDIQIEAIDRVEVLKDILSRLVITALMRNAGDFVVFSQR